MPPYNGSGTATAPVGGSYPAVASTLIESAKNNVLIADVLTMLSTALLKDGQQVATARIPFASGIQTDSVTEKTSDTGVTLDSVLLKDGRVDTTQGADIASAATLNLETATGNVLDVTGTVTVTAVTLSQGHWRLVRFTGALILTNGASLVLPGAANITTVAGDYALFIGYATGVVRVAYVQPTAGNVSRALIAAKGDLLAGTASQTLAAKSIGTDGQSLQADSSQSSGLVYIDNPSRPNLLINQNWLIDQINEGALYTVNAADVRGPDGWSGTEVGAGVFKLRTLADPDNAALKCLEITCTTADAAIAAADDYFIYSAIEGYDAASLMAGTASAQPITVQFKFKSNVTGVYGLSIANSALNRRYIGIITVADTSEHEYSVSLTMDTSGTWLYTNGVGLYLRLCLAAGSNFQGTAGAWAAGAEQTTSAQANFMSVNTNIAYLKRIQLIPGALVQAYRPADIQKELAKAQRYYYKTFPQGTAPAQNAGISGAISSVTNNAAASSFGADFMFPIVMRASPSIVSYNPSAANANWRDTTNGADRTVSNAGDISDRKIGLIGAAGAVNALNLIHAVANARLS